MKAILNSVMMSISSILLMTLLTLGITKLNRYLFCRSKNW